MMKKLLSVVLVLCTLTTSFSGLAVGISAASENSELIDIINEQITKSNDITDDPVSQDNSVEETSSADKNSFAVIPDRATAAYSGTCGDNLTWTLSDDGTLTISGTGDMYDFSYPTYAPWYTYRSNIQTVIIEDSVTSIGDYSFYKCTSLTSVTIGNSVTSIGDWSFATCRSLENINIPNSVEYIGELAFSSSKLINVTIPNSVKWLGDAFDGCEHLENVTLSDSLTEILNYTFYGCTSLKNVTIPDSVISISHDAFLNCTALESLTISNSVTSIESTAFNNCPSLSDIYFIGTEAEWKEITIGNYNESLTNATIHYSVANGICGDNLTWDLYDNGTLKISGTGDMYDYEYTGNWAPWFGYNEPLYSVVIENSVTSIGDNAFVCCGSLTSVTIGDSVTSIGNWAFDSCYSLTSVTIPDSVISIGKDAFWCCESLTSVTIGNSVISIGNWAFDGCESLTTITIPDSVTSIGEGAFRYCPNLTSVTIGNSVTSIGNSAFEDCYSLTSVTIGDSVISIGNDAFWYCESLTDVYYNGTEEQWAKINIGTGNDKLTSANIHYCLASGKCGDNLTWRLSDDGTLTISGTGNMYDYNFDDSPWFNYRSYIMEVIIDDSVTSIGACSFENFKSITSITIGDSVTSIGGMSFGGCTSLTSMSIGDSVTNIGDWAFSYCEALENVDVPNSVIYIGENAFEGCISLTSITIGNSVTNIGKYAFFDCTSLTSVIIPNSVTTIDEYAFECCTSLASVTIPNSVTSIKSGTFYWCTSLTSITISDSVTSIGDVAFQGCISLTDVYYKDTEEQWAKINIGTGNDKLTSANIHYCLASGKCGDNLTWRLSDDGTLTISGTGDMYDYEYQSSAPYTTTPWGNYYTSVKSVVIGDSVTSIGDYAFRSCTFLTSVIMGDSVTSIGECAFYYCTSLASVTIGDAVTSIGDLAFRSCTNLANVTIGDSVTIIGDEAFCYCASLTSVTIPDSVTSIGYDAFFGCTSLTTVTIPNSVTSIGECTFECCTSLTSVTIPDSVTSIGNYAFAYCTSLNDVYYKGTKEQWNNITIGADNEVLTSANIHYCLASGECGDDLTWNLYNNGTLKISGTGDMYDYEFTGNRAPWFGYNEPLYSVVIENSVTSIGDNAFVCCGSLTSVTIGDSVTSIGNCAFDSCYSLTSVTIPDSVISIGSSAFWCCENLTSVTIGNSVTSIGTETFDGCESLTSITIPDSVTSIGRYAFRFCYNLTSVTIGNSVTSIGDDTFEDCYSLTNVTIPDSVTSIGDYAFHDYYGKPLKLTINCYKDSYAHTYAVNNGFKYKWIGNHTFTVYVSDNNATCTEDGTKTAYCDCGCGLSETIVDEGSALGHTYSTKVIDPTYFEQGYTIYTCSACSDSYNDNYTDPLERTALSEAKIELEYTSVFYQGEPLTPSVTLTYDGEEYDAATELKLTYTNNDKVGTATVTVEGINKFTGTVELTFEISYEKIPQTIVNVIAVSEINKVSLSWGISSEVDTDEYKIYRKADDETEFRLIKLITGRHVLSYEDILVTPGTSYSYYITGVGLYGAESEPSLTVNASALKDNIPPTMLKLYPVSGGVLTGSVKLTSTATDNIGVKKVLYYYSLDSGTTWNEIGCGTGSGFPVTLDTSAFDAVSIQIKAEAYDAVENFSTPIVNTYILDNIGPDKVTGLNYTALSSKITLSWNDVSANDAAYFVLQMYNNDTWTTVATKITTLGYTVTALAPDTDYIFRVACVDKCGNVGEYSDVFTARTVVDETAPVITAQSPAPGRYNSSIAYSATAKDDCNIEHIEIQTSADLSVWTTVSTQVYSSYSYQQSCKYTIDLSGYAEGSLYVRAIAYDFTGNCSDTSATAPYTEYIVDRTAPAAPTGIAANGKDGYITVSWAMNTENDVNRYYVYKSTSIDGNYQLVSSGLTTLNFHDRDVQSGNEFFYKVKVSDLCGNMSEFSSAVSATMSEDTTMPEITGISSTYEQKISETNHTISISAQDNNKLSYILVEYYTTKSPEYKQLVKVESINASYKNINITLPIEEMENGDSIHLRAYAVDMAGLRSPVVTAKYTLDTQAPNINSFNAVTENNIITLTWSDARESDLSGFNVYRSADGVNYSLLGSRAINSSGSYSFTDTISATEDKYYIYKLVAIDRVGNTSSALCEADYTYVYVNTAPIAKINVSNYMTVGVEDLFDASASTDNMAISSYLWDFGDGTTSNEVKIAKSYDVAGKYAVTLTVTDNEGLTSSVSKEIEVKERNVLGTLTVKVVDDKGKALSYVPVYFDLGSDNQQIVYTNAEGSATLSMPSGTHTVGMYASGYLPVKKDAVVLANATRTVTLTTVEEEIVTGEFEITRMTFDEIVEAGIDVYDPANQNVYSATVRVTYGSSAPLTINYVRNDNNILSYTVKDSNGKPVSVYTNSNGETRKITGITYIPNIGGGSSQDIVAIMDIPAQASYLKEFFDVRLHIVNNAATEFVLEKNEIVLNVPEGMTLMNSVSGEYNTSNIVNVDSIRGQQTVTLAWVLRGDTAGEYDLTADFTGTLAEFNEIVTARFETKEPIKVYGLEGVKFKILCSDEIHNDTLYFNVELENERDIDIYMPNIGVTDKIKNITESVLYDNAEEDFFSEPFILNAYIENENGEKIYLPLSYDANGKVTTDIDTLAPGQKLVYEYVAYNAINYDGVAYFKDATIVEFEGLIENIEVGSFRKELYSFNDYSEKLQDILSATEGEIADAYNYISNDGNYYYVNEAENTLTDVCQVLYGFTDLALSGDVSYFTQEEERQLIENILLQIFSDTSGVEAVDTLIAQKYMKSVMSIIAQVKLNMINRYEDYYQYWSNEGGIIDGEDPKFPLDEFPSMDGKNPNQYFDEVFSSIAKDGKSLAVIYMRDGEEAFTKALQKKITGYGIGVAINEFTIDNKAAFRDQLTNGRMLASEVINLLSKTEQDAYVYSVLKLECNAEYVNFVLDAIMQNTLDPRILYVAADLKNTLNTKLSEQEYKIISLVENFAEQTGTYLAKETINSFMKSALSMTPAILLNVVKFVFDVINIDGFYKQQADLDVYNQLSTALAKAFADAGAKADDDQSKGYAMCMLKALCELRLEGETEFKSFMDDYMDGKYALPLSEETILEEINKVKNTEYTSFEMWWDDVQYNILRSRDILFNIENSSNTEKPRAPIVTLDYDKLRSVQSFSPEYEYCFADGVWKSCTNEPISFTVGTVPSTLRVRVAATDTTPAGNITTVKILARKNLSKLISIKYDSSRYYVSGLTAERNYQILFLNSEEDPINWSEALTFGGSNETVVLTGIGHYPVVVIRSTQNSALNETTSNPLTLNVIEKQHFDLIIEGSGSVAQSDVSGCYFVGDNIDLVAKANDGYLFIGWYIDGTCVSTDKNYTIEMSADLTVTAKFNGIKIKSVMVETPPVKRSYYEGEELDLNGMVVVVTYTNGAKLYTEDYTAYIGLGSVGKSFVIVNFGGKTTRFDITINHVVGDWIVISEPTEITDGLHIKRCSICGEIAQRKVIPSFSTESVPVISVDNFNVMITNSSYINHIRYASGILTTSSEIRNAPDCVNIDLKTIAENTTDDIYTRVMPFGGVYSFWIRMNDGSTYIRTADLTSMLPKLTSDGVKITAHNLYGVKDIFIAEGNYNTYRAVADNMIVRITPTKLANAHDYTYVVYNPGVHTVCIRYEDPSKENDILKINLTVTEPTFTHDGLQLHVGNLSGVKVIRTAYGNYNSSSEIKKAQGCRNLTNKYDIKDADAYTVQYRTGGLVSIAVEYYNGYVKIYHYTVQKKEPVVVQVGNSVAFSNLEGLHIIRYALGTYDSSAEIKRAPGSKVVYASSMIDDQIVISDLTKGTYTFCVQYTDDSYSLIKNVCIE